LTTRATPPNLLQGKEVRAHDVHRRLRERLARRTTSTAPSPRIDGLRFVAIGLVLLFHADLMMRLATGDGRLTQPFGIVVLHRGRIPARAVRAEGTSASTSFFMISGYVLALPFLAARVSDRPARSASAATTHVG
jgi:peptidoglycan/LPS O-acetylase OafA/YrhL